MFTTICRIGINAIDCYLCNAEEVYRELAPRFKIIGGEKSFVEFYLKFVPKLVEEIKSVMKKSGAKDIFFAGHAERFEETFRDPYLSLCTSMVLDTWQGRALSLQGKISQIVELWVLAKIIESIDGETLDERWWVEFMKNVPFARVRSRVTGKIYTIFYQPTILPHIISFIWGGKRIHLVPDIVVFEGEVERVRWGELYKVIEVGRTPLLVVEVKTGLETTEWRSPEYILKQLEEYRLRLKPQHLALTVLMGAGEFLKSQAKTLGAEVHENLLTPQGLNKFTDYLRNNVFK